MKILLRSILFLTFLFAFCPESNCQPQTLRVLFIGNSYTYVNNLPQLTADVATSMGDSLAFDSYTIGGYTLDQHFADTNCQNKIKAGGWDYVILQEQSQLPAFDDYYSSGPANLSYLVNKFNPCARVMFYMTWGRKNGDASNCPVWPPICTYEGMDSLLRLRYTETAMINHAELSPVGAVWRYIRQHFPTIDLYQPDESHPSVYGSYAAACSFYTALFKKNPVLIPYNYSLTANDADSIKSAAKAIVYDSLAQWNFVDPYPVANFNYTIGFGINETDLFNTSSNTDTYHWDFGDGSFSADTNTIHNYATDGQYIITLTAYHCDLSDTNQSVYQDTVTFCQHNPVITPDSLLLCPGAIDTLWATSSDSYQWLDGQGNIIPGETNQFFIPASWETYSVLSTLLGCTEQSPPAYVQTYSFGLVIYWVDTAGTLISPDTACVGDTLKLFLTPNKPDQLYKRVEWMKDGVLLPNQDDTLLITSSGDYSVSLYRAFCPDYAFLVSQVFSYTFIQCNNAIGELNSHPAIYIFPNPSKENFNVIVSPEYIGKKYSIFDISGRLISHSYFTESTTTINSQKFDRGVYFLRVDSGELSVKLIKE